MNQGWYWWFAWRPVKTQEGRWVWGDRVLRRLQHPHFCDTGPTPNPWLVYTYPKGFAEPAYNCTYPEIADAYRS